MTRQKIDPVIDEIRAIRQRISARFDHDPARLVAHYIELQERHRDRLLDRSKASEPVLTPFPTPSEIDGVSLDHFPRRVVEGAFRKFKDIVQDLFEAKFQAWPNTFTHMMTHCEQNPVMQVVTGPLKVNRQVDAEKWYADTIGSGGGMIGSCHYELPYDDEDRTALLYGFFLKVERGEVDINNYCVNVYGTTRYQDSVEYFNRELVQKFTREVSYRLDEILEDIGDQQEIPREAMVVFHHHDNSMAFHGDFKGSNVAIGGSTVSDSVATYTEHEQVAGALKSLTPLLAGVATGQRAAVAESLEVLVRATHDATVTEHQAEEAARIVTANSPEMSEKLADISKKIGLSLVSSTIFLGLKAAAGIP